MVSWKLLIGLGAAAVTTAACNHDSPNGPSERSTVTALAVTVQDVVLVGKTTTATAIATMSDGKTQPITSGWRTDASTIASVSDSGTVTGMANGRANIAVAFGGQQGSKDIRVAPNYAGSWSGAQQVTGCSATGDFRGICSAPEISSLMGKSFPISLDARHPSDLVVSGEFVVDGDQYPTFTTSIESDGAIKFSSTVTVDEFQLATTWQMNSSSDGRATGSIRESLSAPGVVTGEVLLESTLSGFGRRAALSVRGGQSSHPLRDTLRNRIQRIRR